MQVKNLVSQYYNNLSAGSDVSTKTKGVEQLTSTVNSLQKGQVFEGTIVSVKGSQVTLGLSNGQSISARLDKGISLSPGQSVFFEVKSSSDEMIQIRPVSIGGESSNPTLMNAVSQAGIPMTEANLNLVNSMMQQQLPIDANSLNQMAHLLAAHPGTEPKTLVTLTKNGLPVTDDMITQYNNYKAGEGEILSSVDDLTGGISSFFSSDAVSEDGAASFLKGLSDVLNGQASLQENSNINPEDIQEAPLPAGGGGSSDAAADVPSFPTKGTTIVISLADTPVSAHGENITVPEGAAGAGATAAETASDAASIEASSGEAAMTGADAAAAASDTDAAALAGGKAGAAGGPAADAALAQARAAADLPLSAAPVPAGAAAENAADSASGSGSEGETTAGSDISHVPYMPTEEEADAAGRGTLAKNVSAGDFSTLNNIVKNLGGEDSPAFAKALDENGNLKYDTSAKELFSALVKTAGEKGRTKDLLKEPAFQNLMKGVMGSQWTMEPAELKDPQKVKDLYAKTASDMSLISKAAQDAAGTAGNPVTQTGNALQNNIDFINQVNQAFTYVQIPVKMSNGNANADLYVYTNKKKNPADGDEISAFLHFDMDYLGPTDISVRMRGKSVDTKFFMEDDDSFLLIQNNIHILQDRLEALGYNSKITVEPGDKPVNLIEDILEKDAATAGSLQRYSFDMRA